MNKWPCSICERNCSVVPEQSVECSLNFDPQLLEGFGEPNNYKYPQDVCGEFISRQPPKEPPCLIISIKLTGVKSLAYQGDLENFFRKCLNSVTSTLGKLNDSMSYEEMDVMQKEIAEPQGSSSRISFFKCASATIDVNCLAKLNDFEDQMVYRSRVSHECKAIFDAAKPMAQSVCIIAYCNGDEWSRYGN